MASHQMLSSLWSTATSMWVGLDRPDLDSIKTVLFDEEVETPPSSSGYSSDSGDSLSLPSSSSTSSRSPEDAWEEVEVFNGKWESRGILPGFSAWTPTNLDDGLLDGLSHSSTCPRKEDEDDDEIVWATIMDEILSATDRREDVAAEQADGVLDWGVFIGWAPVPTPEEAEVLAAAAAAEEEKRRAAAASRKAARMDKYKRKFHHW